MLNVSWRHRPARNANSPKRLSLCASSWPLRLTISVRPQAGFDHLDEVLRLDHAAMAEAAALRARTYLQLALPADRVHFIDSEVGLNRCILQHQSNIKQCPPQQVRP